MGNDLDLDFDFDVDADLDRKDKVENAPLIAFIAAIVYLVVQGRIVFAKWVSVFSSFYL